MDSKIPINNLYIKEEIKLMQNNLCISFGAPIFPGNIFSKTHFDISKKYHILENLGLIKKLINGN